MAKIKRTVRRVRPLHDRVLVEPAPFRDAYGAILLPDSVPVDRPAEGKVIAVGTGKLLEDGRRIDVAVVPGDRVQYGRYSGQKLPGDSQREEDYMLLLREDEIISVFVEEEVEVDEDDLPDDYADPDKYGVDDAAADEDALLKKKLDEIDGSSK